MRHENPRGESNENSVLEQGTVACAHRLARQRSRGRALCPAAIPLFRCSRYRPRNPTRRPRWFTARL